MLSHVFCPRVDLLFKAYPYTGIPIQETFSAHTFREISGNIQGIFREHLVNIQGTFINHMARVKFY